MFKGTPKNPDIDKQFNQRGARFNGTTSLDRTNYYELVPASDENLKWAHRAGGRPHGQLLHREEGPRQRDDGGAKRVRAGREQPLPGADEAPAERRLRLAQLRQLDHRQPERHRERQDREPAGVLPHVLPARQRGAAGRGQVRRGQGDPVRREGFRRDPEAQAPAPGALDDGTDAGRREVLHGAAQGRHPGRGRRLQDSLQPACGFRPAGRRRLPAGRHADGQAAQGAGGNRQGGAGVLDAAWRCGSGAATLRRRGEGGRRVGAGARRTHPHCRGVPQDAGERAGSRALPQDGTEPDREAAGQPRVDRRAVVGIHRAGRLAAVFPRAGRPCQADAWEDRGSGQGVLPPRQPHRGAVRARGQPAARGDTGRAESCRRDEGLQGQGGYLGVRGLRSVAGEHRQAHQAQHDRRREDGACSRRRTAARPSTR